MDAKTVGRNIADLRKQHSMTQKELAQKLNVIDKTISRWECGYGLPDVSMLPAIAEVFGVSIEQLIGESPVPQTTARSSGVPVAEESPPSRKLGWFVRLPKAVVFLLIAVCLAACIAPVLVYIVSAQKEASVQTIERHAWEQAVESQADYVFLTAFGLEECMCLELNGDLKGGAFVCTESWRKSTGGTLLDCQARGTYSIGKATAEGIRFFVDEIIDPERTEKLRSNRTLGLDYFTGKCESGVYDNASEASFNGTEIEAVVFFADVKDSETSVFGRWTQKNNYYSRTESEIYFSRIHGELTERQKGQLHVEAQKALHVVAPEKLEITTKPNKTEYYVGERLDLDGMVVSILYTDGTEKQADGVCEVEEPERFINPENREIVITYRGTYRTLTVSLRMKVVYGYAWEIAQSSTADRLFFTHYATGRTLKTAAFGALELYGDASGFFVYTETYGKSVLNGNVVLVGTYAERDGEIYFTFDRIYSATEGQQRFAADEYAARITATDGSGIVFHTTSEERNFFGYYANVADDGVVFSQTEGEIYLEEMTAGCFSARAIKALKEYGKLD